MSSYREDSDYIKEVAGYDCSILNDDQMDLVGMAAENGALVWDWGNTSPDDMRPQAVRARDELANTGWNSLEECVQAYVGGAWDSLGL